MRREVASGVEIFDPDDDGGSTSTRGSDRSESPPLHPCAFGAEEDSTTTLALGDGSDDPDDVSPEDFLYYNPSGGVAGVQPPIDPDFLFFNPSIRGMDPYGVTRKESDEDPVYYNQVPCARLNVLS